MSGGENGDATGSRVRFFLDFYDIAAGASFGQSSSGRMSSSTAMSSNRSLHVRVLVKEIQKDVDGPMGGYDVREIGQLVRGNFYKFRTSETVGDVAVCSQTGEPVSSMNIVARIEKRKPTTARSEGDQATQMQKNKSIAPPKRAPQAAAPVVAAAPAEGRIGSAGARAAAEACAELRIAGKAAAAPKKKKPTVAAASNAAMVMAPTSLDDLPKDHLPKFVRKSTNNGGKTIYGGLVELFGQAFELRRLEFASDAARVIDLYRIAAGLPPMNFVGEAGVDATYAWLKQQKATRRDMIKKKTEEIKGRREAAEAGTGPAVDAPLAPREPSGKRKAEADVAPVMGGVEEGQITKPMKSAKKTPRKTWGGVDLMLYDEAENVNGGKQRVEVKKSSKKY